MRKAILLIIFIFSIHLHAACKCSCDPTDFRACASSYDLDNPCGGMCPSQSPGITPMITACPLSLIPNRISGIKVPISICPNL
jgi:hypothetical protein